jgi:hypothetical protein
MKSITRVAFCIFSTAALWLASCEQVSEVAPPEVSRHDSVSVLQTIKLNDSTHQFVVVKGYHDTAYAVRWLVEGVDAWGDTLTHEASGIRVYRVQAQLIRVDSSTVRTLDTVVASGLPLGLPPLEIFKKCEIVFSYFGRHTNIVNGYLREREEFSRKVDLLYWSTNQVFTDSSYTASMQRSSTGWYESGENEKLEWNLSSDLGVLRSFIYLVDNFWKDGQKGGTRYLSINVLDAQCIGANNYQAVYLVNGDALSERAKFHHRQTENPSSVDSLESIDDQVPPKPYATLTFRKLN